MLVKSRNLSCISCAPASGRGLEINTVMYINIYILISKPTRCSASICKTTDEQIGQLHSVCSYNPSLERAIQVIDMTHDPSPPPSPSPNGLC